MLGLKSQNGYGPPKPPLGSPLPRLSKTPPNTPTILDEPGKKVKKSAPLPFTSPPHRAAQGPHGASGRGGGHRPGSWDGRGATPSPSTSPRLPAAVTANGPATGGTSPEPNMKGASAPSPEPSASSDPASAPTTPEGRATPLGDPQGANPSVPPDGEDPKAAKPKSPVPSSTATEPASIMSPPPAKKLALSAKKVGVWGSRRSKCLWGSESRFGGGLRWGGFEGGPLGSLG